MLHIGCGVIYEELMECNPSVLIQHRPSSLIFYLV